MEEPRETPRPAGPPAASMPGYPSPQPAAYYAPAPSAAPARRNLFFRTLRLLLRRLVYGIVLVGRGLWPHRLTLAVAGLLLFVIAALSFQLWIAPILAGRITDTRVAFMPPPGAVESYLRGKQNYDANLIWESLSPRLQAQLLEQGASKSTLQAQADNEELIGQRYPRYDYIGGIQLEAGGAMFFYLVEVESPRLNANGPTSYVFEVDSDGKIVGIY